ncbi:hypothetical protein GJA_4141 [Janthinobacterium agaricidamnosum NBRC 102515 = DSM 9628]|uniref:Uncharacterized protein n=1 Tax=Janthinobacterium agaricidamnosum NBRC 102515 = DSM 9628 TaxID=1349767 RepID=W0VA31_9BURK|nr:hypothetical protein GJA_4141 [Janthinobacterium agaricidamnosum NBRC 102515 = DSM 9628]
MGGLSIRPWCAISLLLISHGVRMSKAQDSKKESKKEPAKTMKEKKEAKKAKKEERKH